MKRDKDIIALTELLKMAADGPIPIANLTKRSVPPRSVMLEMWPAACRRAGVGGRDFPSGVIKLWKQGVGDVN